MARLWEEKGNEPPTPLHVALAAHARKLKNARRLSVCPKHFGKLWGTMKSRKHFVVWQLIHARK